MEFSTILTTALSTGLATAILNQAIGWWRDSNKDRTVTAREARYLAIRLAVLLERFALDCADSVAAYEMHSEFDGYAGRASGTIPKLQNFQTEIGARSTQISLGGVYRSKTKSN